MGEHKDKQRVRKSGLGNTRVGVEKEQSVQAVESEWPERRETRESTVWLQECQGGRGRGALCHRCQGGERKWPERTPWGLAIREPSVRRS